MSLLHLSTHTACIPFWLTGMHFVVPVVVVVAVVVVVSWGEAAPAPAPAAGMLMFAAGDQHPADVLAASHNLHVWSLLLLLLLLLLVWVLLPPSRTPKGGWLRMLDKISRGERDDEDEDDDDDIGVVAAAPPDVTVCMLVPASSSIRMQYCRVVGSMAVCWETCLCPLGRYRYLSVGR